MANTQTWRIKKRWVSKFEEFSDHRFLLSDTECTAFIAFGKNEWTHSLVRQKSKAWN